jgi:hypothetical protein
MTPESDHSSPEESVIVEEVSELSQNLSEKEHKRSESLSQAAQSLTESYSGSEHQEELQMAELPPGGAQNIAEILPRIGEGIAQILEQIRELRQQVRKIQDGPRLCGIRVKYMLVFGGIVSGINASIALYFTLKKDVASNRVALASMESNLGALPAPLSLAARFSRHGSIHLAIPRCRQTWPTGGRLADFVTNNAPRSYQEQLMFTQFTEDIARDLMPGTFQWKTARDKLTLIGQLAALIQKQGLAAMYRRLPQMTYQNKPLPRAIAANLASHAILSWWAEQ